MLKDYICRQDLLAELSAGCMPIDEKGVSGLTGDNECIRDCINNAPKADAAEIKHAHWETAIGYDPQKTVQCQNCLKMNYEPTDYCPHCGCRMDGDRK